MIKNEEDYAALVERAELKAYECLYFLSRKKIGSIPVEPIAKRLLFVKKISRATRLVDQKICQLKPPFPVEIKKICTDEISEASRFSLDIRFRPFVKRLYNQWIENYNKVCLFSYQDRNKSCGFITLKTIKSEAFIDLFGVVNSCRGRGIGRALLIAAEEWALRRHCNKIKVVTYNQNNSAVAAYQALNYKIQDESFYYHLWIR